MPALLAIWGFIKGLSPKTWLVVIVIAGSAYAGWWARGTIATAEANEAMRRLIAQTEAQMKEDREILENSLEVQTQIKYRYRKRADEAENVKSPCPKLGADWVGVLHGSIEDLKAVTGKLHGAM